jgi:hypothetical protein
MRDRRCPYCQQVFWPDAYHPQQLVCSQANGYGQADCVAKESDPYAEQKKLRVTYHCGSSETDSA